MHVNVLISCVISFWALFYFGLYTIHAHIYIHTASIVVCDMQLPAILPFTDRMVVLKWELKGSKLHNGIHSSVLLKWNGINQEMIWFVTVLFIYFNFAIFSILIVHNYLMVGDWCNTATSHQSIQCYYIIIIFLI